jgi:hypothetical protein
MGAMASRGPPAVAPEPLDAPPPAPPLPHPGVTFKDAVASEPTPAGKRGASPARAKGAAGSPGKGGGGAEMTAPTHTGAATADDEKEEKSLKEAVAETTEAAARKTVAATGLWRPFRFLARTSNKGVSKLTHSKRFIAAVRTQASERASVRACVCVRVVRCGHRRGAAALEARALHARGWRADSCVCRGFGYLCARARARALLRRRWTTSSKSATWTTTVRSVARAAQATRCRAQMPRADAARRHANRDAMRLLVPLRVRRASATAARRPPRRCP